MTFNFEGNEIALDSIATGEEIVEALLGAKAGCPISNTVKTVGEDKTVHYSEEPINKTIHFERILGKGAADAPAWEITIDGYGTKKYVAKVFNPIIKQKYISGKMTLRRAAKHYQKHDGIPSKLIIMLNGGDPKRMVTNEKICIPSEITLCKTAQEQDFERFDGLGVVNIPKGSYLCDNELFSEYYIGLLCGLMYRGIFLATEYVGMCINFIDLFGFTMCVGNCKINQYLFMEKIDSTVFKIQNLKDFAYDSLYMQTLFALSTMQLIYGIQHGDLHADNLFLERVKPNSTYMDQNLYTANYFEYRIGKNSYYVQNVGYILKIGDFGMSVKYDHPIIGNKYVFENGYDQGDGDGPWIPNWQTMTYDFLYMTKRLSELSPLAKKILGRIQNLYPKTKLFTKNDRPILENLEALDANPEIADFANNPLITPFKEKPRSGNIVLVCDLPIVN